MVPPGTNGGAAAPSVARLSLLVVVTRDFGELGQALYFIGGLPIEYGGLLLIPRSTPEQGAPPPGFEWRRYSCREDIEFAARDCHPAHVLFFSAYLLLGTAPGLGLLGIGRMMRKLRQGGAAIATSDPFLGLLRSPTALHLHEIVATHLNAQPRWRVTWTSVSLAWRLFALAHLLRPCLHLYPASIAATDPPAGLRWKHFSAGLPLEAPPEPMADTTTTPLWMFVMSRVDHDLLSAQQGPALATLLAERLQDAVAAGANVLMVAPQSLLSTLAQHLPDLVGRGIELVETLPIAHYLAALRRAQYAFFWNRFSFSILYRVLDRTPVFFFGAGHVELMLPAFGAAGASCFYAGWIPPLRALTDTLDVSSLAFDAAAQAPRYATAAHALRAGDKPAQVVARNNTMHFAGSGNG